MTLAIAPPITLSAQLPLVEREVRGDTTHVRTISGAEWATGMRLTEELRVGTLAGPDEYTLGDVTEIAPDGLGGFYAFDRQVPAIRHYDRDGRFLKTIGREGQGPGEYGDAILGLALDDKGRLVEQYVVRLVLIAEAASPQVVVLERQVGTDDYVLNATIDVGESEIVAQLIGSEDIVEWIDLGLPIRDGERAKRTDAM